MGQDEASGELFLVQALLSGHDLAHHLESAGRLTPARALHLIAPVMEALVVAHAHGVVHRDLKPDNIFLAEDARGLTPTLIDFGIAKVVGEDGGSLQETSAGALMGTPNYMSPEHARGETNLDARADVWSLGVVLYEMLSGALPYTAPNVNVLIGKILYEEPRSLVDAAPDLPRALADVVMGALVRDRHGRYPTMQAFLDAVRGSVTDAVPGPSDLRSPPMQLESPRTAPERLVAPTLAAHPPVMVLATAPRGEGRRGGIVAAALLGAVAIVAVAFLLRGAPAPVARAAEPAGRAVVEPTSIVRPPTPEPAPQDAGVAPGIAVVAPPPTRNPVAGATRTTPSRGAPRERPGRPRRTADPAPRPTSTPSNGIGVL